MFRWLSGVLPSRVIANSEATLNTLRLDQLDRSEAIYSGFEPRSRMRVVHDGLKTVTSPDVARSIRRVGIVVCGSPWKGQDVFLRAAAIIHERFPEVCFQIIGAPLFKEEQYERALRRLRT